MKKHFILILSALLLMSCAPEPWTQVEKDGFVQIEQKGTPSLGYSLESGVNILTVDGRPFKDLDKDGELDVYEDWRESFETRAKDLASKMSIRDIFGIMTYGGWDTREVYDSEVTDPLKRDIDTLGYRNFILVHVHDTNPYVVVTRNNKVQVLAEGLGWGIPVNFSSDPRTYLASDSEFNCATGPISRWPRELGLASTFDMDVVRTHAYTVSKEYRALGIATALSPEVDLASEPRWRRFYGTYGESTKLITDIGREYVDGFQTSKGDKELCDGWGFESINCMVKHWPGGGSGEGGRDAHFDFGKYAVYPGNNFEEHLIPFVKGVLKLRGKTKQAAAMMPYYTISYGQDPSGENVGNGFSKWIIKDLLRTKYGYDGLVCTDWSIVKNYKGFHQGGGKCWGVEDVDPAVKRLMVFEAGCDQLGGGSDHETDMKAYNLWCEKYGEENARQRYEESAVRILKTFFQTGLFENPYSDPEVACKVIASDEAVEAGLDAQRKSVVMVKNHNSALPVAQGSKVYMTKRYFAGNTWFEAEWKWPLDSAAVAKYYTITDNPEEADFALVRIESIMPLQGYSEDDAEKGGSGVVPISLQYSDYTAENAREIAIAGDDEADRLRRTYKGKTVKALNANDMETVQAVRKLMGDKPVVMSCTMWRPIVMTEVEPYADAVLITCGVSDNCVMDIVSGEFEPYGLLPCQLPADMNTVETQQEDVPFDMECYKDADGNVYDFAFGLNWKGQIRDARYRKYCRK